MNLEAFYSLSYGLYIISSEADGKKNGYVANTVFQVTANPPQLAISCSKNNLSAEIIDKCSFFSVSVLNQAVSKNLLGRFGYKSGKEIDKFDGTDAITGKTGIPIVIEDSIAWFECKVVQRIDVGSHILFIGEVLDGEILDSKINEPMTYAFYRNVRKGLAPKNAPTYIEKAKKPMTNDEKVSEKPSVSDASTQKWECLVCGHIYDPAEGDPDSGIAPGTPFEALPDDWVCPECGAEKSDFQPI